ncbi:paraquat-inducible protein A [Brenneria corticis]|uniref:Paraquat-inducible membrane protein A n=1 Tax=Brenneria corticis TaxID=2173106 RepID=A0A2U1U332_9GAMM|nr:paraquat-inducible protein A [Brenneria sp. CFCC 11842]PWC16053.1 paraquat-inducible membrane protein A [Brenneria sp. CFCC 11842]
MKTFPDLVICRHCDSVYHRRTPAAGAEARCRRCGLTLYRANPVPLDRWLALTMTAAIAFIIANLCPILQVSLYGLRNEVTLWQCVAALSHGATLPLAVCAFLLLMLVPGLQILLLGWILVFARRDRAAPGFIPAMKTLRLLRPWSMIEVGMLGLMVAAVKLAGFLQVVSGAGSWALAALMFLIAIICRQDTHALWELAAARRGAGAMP